MTSPQRSGTYAYFVDGTMTAREDWIDWTDDQGRRHVRCVRDASQFGVHLGLTSSFTADGRAAHIFELREHANGPLKKAAYYETAGDQVQFRMDASAPWKIVETDGAIFFPLMRIFTADMVRSLDQSGGTGVVVVPSIEQLNEIDTIFEPIVSTRNVVRIGLKGDCFDLMGGAYEAPTRIWINAQGHLENYAFVDPKGVRWTCQLIGNTSV